MINRWIARVLATILGWNTEWHDYWTARYNVAVDVYNAEVDAHNARIDREAER